ncbi:MAG: RNA 2',3'-cyclic phosphodiesterase [Deltaproteobacteria bacterium]|nr:RNA 2',3'-cyclic phosphodiesterase [Deltaproteobacteria bacterium]
MKTVRCFLAINLELKTAVKISELQQSLIADSAEFKSEFLWVPPQNMHVTVRFLGNITEPMIQAIKDSLEETTRNCAPFVMEAGAVGVFDADSPKVLYCEINDPNNELFQLVSGVHNVLENTGFKEIEKPYIPHVTLARIADGDADEIKQLVEKYSSPLGCASSVRTLVCYQSQLMKSGVDYQLLWKLPLEKRMQSPGSPPLKKEIEAPPQSDEESESPSEDSASTAPDESANNTNSDAESVEQGEKQQ